MSPLIYNLRPCLLIYRVIDLIKCPKGCRGILGPKPLDDVGRGRQAWQETRLTVQTLQKKGVIETPQMIYTTLLDFIMRFYMMLWKVYYCSNKLERYLMNGGRVEFI